MDADLVLEGGGVKGIGLVGALSVLAEAGWRFRRVAGTSAGAIVAALVAAGMSTGELEAEMRALRYERFRDEGLLDRVGIVGKGLSLLFEQGVYEGRELTSWLSGHLARYGVSTFGDLRIDDLGADRPGQAYRLVVLATDVSRGRLVRLPWDYVDYGLDPDVQPVAEAVRASAAIPFYFEPSRLAGADGTEYVLVDGGLLSNFPVGVFDRADRRPPRWPTIGIKLSARPEARRIDDTFGFVRAVTSTLVAALDHVHLDDPCVTERTVFVDTASVRSVDFDLEPEEREALYGNGRSAAQRFLAGWDFDEHLRRCRPWAAPARAR